MAKNKNKRPTTNNKNSGLQVAEPASPESDKPTPASHDPAPDRAPEPGEEARGGGAIVSWWQAITQSLRPIGRRTGSEAMDEAAFKFLLDSLKGAADRARECPGNKLVNTLNTLLERTPRGVASATEQQELAQLRKSCSVRLGFIKTQLDKSGSLQEDGREITQARNEIANSIETLITALRARYPEFARVYDLPPQKKQTKFLDVDKPLGLQQVEQHSDSNIMEKFLADLQGQLESAKSEKTGLQSQLETVSSEKAGLQGKLETARSEKADVQGKLETVRTEKAGLQSQLDTAKEKLGTTEAERTRVLGERDRALHQAGELNQKVSRLETAVSAAEKRASDLAARVRVHENTDVALLQRDLDTANATITQTQAECVDLVKQRDAALQKEKTVRLALEQQETEILSLRANYQAAIRERDDAVGKLSSLEHDLTELTRQLASEKERIASFKHRLEEASNKISTLQARVEALSEERDALQTQLEKKDALVLQQEEELRSVRQRHEQKVAELEQSHQTALADLVATKDGEREALEMLKNRQMGMLQSERDALFQEKQDRDNPVWAYHQLEEATQRNALSPIALETFNQICETIQRAELRDDAWIRKNIELFNRFVYLPPQPAIWQQHGDRDPIERVHQVLLLQLYASNRLQEHGLETIYPQHGERFDPVLHEAGDRDLVYIDSEEKLHNCVERVVLMGFRFGQEVLRKARVRRYIYERTGNATAEPVNRPTPLGANALAAAPILFAETKAQAPVAVAPVEERPVARVEPEKGELEEAQAVTVRAKLEEGRPTYVGTPVEPLPIDAPVIPVDHAAGSEAALPSTPVVEAGVQEADKPHAEEPEARSEAELLQKYFGQMPQ